MLDNRAVLDIFNSNKQLNKKEVYMRKALMI